MLFILPNCLPDEINTKTQNGVAILCFGISAPEHQVNKSQLCLTLCNEFVIA